MSHTWDVHVAEQWKHVTPPGHPSPSELRIYGHYLRKLRNVPDARVLILGSTPELRDLCLEHGISHTCVDYNKRNFTILKHLMRRKGKEQLINADWRSMKLTMKYDLAMGDIALQMVPLADNPKILSKVASALKPGGRFVHRNWLSNPKTYKSIEGVARMPRHRKGTFYSLAFPLVQHCTRRGIVHYAQGIVPTARKAYERGLLTKREYGDLWNAWHAYKMPNYLPTKEQFERVVRQFFTIGAIRHGTNWYGRQIPMHVLERR